MAKTAVVKQRDVSVHSRAARRNASSPAKEVVNADSTETSDYKPWLHNAQNAGIQKKKKAKTLTRQQKLRQQRGLEKADANVDKLAKKVADSKKRAKKIQSRAVEWEELNEKLEGKRRQAEEAKAQDKKDSGDRDGDVIVPDLEQTLPVKTEEKSKVEEQQVVPLGEQQGEIDEVL